MLEWKLGDRIALDCANELDDLSLRRRGEITEQITFEKIYGFEAKLRTHLNLMNKSISDGKVPLFYFHNNPLIEGVMNFYNVSLKDYEDANRTKATDVIKDIKIGVEMILEQLEVVDQEPTKVPLTEIDSLINLAVDITRYEQAFFWRTDNFRLYAAA